MVALGIISVPFCLVSLYFLGTYFQFKIYGKKIRAKVFAYEKYISTTRTSNGGSSSQLYYAPIYKFLHSGNEYYLKGSGRNYFAYKIGEKEKILMLNNNPKSIIVENSIYPLFGLAFGAFGFGAQVYYHLNQTRNITEHFYPLFIAIGAVVGFYLFLKKKGLLQEVVKAHYENQNLTTLENLKSSENEVYYKNSDITKEESRTSKLALIITLVFLAGMLFGVRHGWQKLNPSIKNIFLEGESFKLLLDHKENPMLILLIFSSVMSLMLFYSCLRSLRRL